MFCSVTMTLSHSMVLAEEAGLEGDGCERSPLGNAHQSFLGKNVEEASFFSLSPQALI